MKAPARLEVLQNCFRRFRFRGVERLLLAVRPLLRPPKALVGTCQGTRVHMNAFSDLQYLNFFHFGGFEHVQLMEEVLRPGQTVIDVGANYGYLSCHAARIVGPTGCVIAVEPNPRAASRLLENVAFNGYSIVRHVTSAISDCPGDATFIIAMSDDLSRLECEKQNDFGLIPEERITVRVTTLDTVVAEDLGGRNVDLVKIDVEGRELNVLKGATSLLARGKTCFILEVNGGALAQNRVSFVDIHDFLVGYGYKIYAIGNASGNTISFARHALMRELTDPSRLGRFADLIAVPASHPVAHANGGR